MKTPMVKTRRSGVLAKQRAAPGKESPGDENSHGKNQQVWPPWLNKKRPRGRRASVM